MVDLRSSLIPRAALETVSAVSTSSTDGSVIDLHAPADRPLPPIELTPLIEPTPLIERSC
ncbi:hypothetical protein [Glaciibacter psychrotolerans]|uniref:Uncharacterized protein n=1 Tax=Glaciibacter psychrotolerans TaxID=670054 RepID=A0A7Z0EF95_9MICO|nr:hypothetical protein [Leifsonia psychrotolerans]NYJ20529.1 hypothetical protein [Leifsonia psychrotolerans]